MQHARRLHVTCIPFGIVGVPSIPFVYEVLKIVTHFSLYKPAVAVNARARREERASSNADAADRGAPPRPRRQVPVWEQSVPHCDLGTGRRGQVW